jgi:hypothetical protein
VLGKAPAFKACAADVGSRVRAGLVASALSGAPSTLWALVRGTDPLEATVAAGQLLCPGESRRTRLLPAAGLVHIALSLGWAAVLGALMPRHTSAARAVALGAACGAGIAAVDLGTARVSSSPRMAAVRSLAVGPQVADHLAYGVIVAVVLGRERPVGAFSR